MSTSYVNDIKISDTSKVYENLHKYPGMCRPYVKNNNNNDKTHSKATEAKSSKNSGFGSTSNPFSIYDDDSADHYFLVPASQLDLAKFKRQFNEINDTKRKTCKKQQRCTTNRNILTEQRLNLIKKHQQKTLNGDYCNISKTAKPLLKTIPTSTNIQTSHLKENMTDFASKLVTSSDHVTYDDKKMKRTKDALIEIHSSTKSNKKSKKQHRTNKLIGVCTCMVCVKAVSYHFTGDDTDEYIDPCSCSGGSNKSIAGRWLCMGALALFLPCMLCYLPAKLCQNSCSKDTCKSRLKCPVTDESYEVRYVRDPTDSSTLL